MYRVLLLGFFSLLSVLPAQALAQVTASPSHSTSGSYTLTWSGTYISATVLEAVNGNLEASYDVDGSQITLTGKENGTYNYTVITQQRPSDCNPWLGCMPVLLGETSVTVELVPPPTAPSHISIPSSSTTGGYSVSWPTASGVLTHYQLQERRNGGQWSTVYGGMARSQLYNKAAGSHYDYRVRACNNAACSAYTAHQGINLPSATLSASMTASMGYTNTPFTVEWSSSMTTSCTWDGTTLPGTSGEYSKIVTGWTDDSMSGFHLKSTSISCNIIGGGVVSRSLHLTALGTRPKPLVSASWNKSAMDIGASAQLSWSAEHADSCSLDGSGVSAEGNRNFSFSSNGSKQKTVVCSNVSGSSSVSATISVVYPTPSRPSYINIPASTSNGEYVISWPASTGAITEYVLQERANGGSWVTVQNTTSRSRSFSKGPNTYYDYRVRACNHSSCSSYTTYGRIEIPQASLSVSLENGSDIQFTTDPVMVSWQSVMTTSCRWDEGALPSTNGTATLQLNNWNYDSFNEWHYSTARIICAKKGGGEVSAPINIIDVHIPPKPTVNLSWGAVQRNVGEVAQLNWNTSDADSCTLDGGGVTTSGSRNYTFSSNGSVTKTVTCTNGQGSTSASATINMVYPAPTFSASISSDYGPSHWGFTDIPFTLTWNASNISSCHYYDSTGGALSVTNRPGSGSVALNGAQLNWAQVNAAPYAYGSQITVRCDALNGSTPTQVFDLSAEFQSIPVAPMVNASWDSSLVARNEPAVFSWSSEYASSCSLNGDSVSNNGTRSASFSVAGTQTWTLSCVNASSSRSSSDSLEVAASLYLPDLDFPAAQNPSDDNLDGDNYFGVLAGEHSVSDTGAFSYKLPIDVPPGINGMQPNIALSYSSDANQGLLGWGWSLSGLSSIGRCPASLAQDGYISGIGSNDAYQYCLDGERLVSVGGNEYRTQTESFIKVTKESSHWVVHNSDGGKSYYGVETTSNAIMLDEHSDPIKWFIDRKADVAGNYMTYQYQTDSDSVALRIQEITYTKNDTVTGLGHSLEFFYESRADTSIKYIADTRVDSDVRLMRIEAKANENIIYSYHLDYEAFDGIQYADPTQISRIQSITKCYTTTATCADPVSFEWTLSDANSFVLDTDDRVYVLPEDISEERYGSNIVGRITPESVGGRKALKEFGVRGDFDGDGLMEAAWMDCQEEATQENWETQTCNRVVAMSSDSEGVVFEHALARQVLNSTSANSSGTPSIAQSNGTLVGQTLDFNGDGLDDYYMHNSHGMVDLKVYLSDASNLAYSESYSKTMTQLGNFSGTIASSAGTSVTTIWRYNFVILDVDGDGLPDLVRLPHWDSGNEWITIGDAGVTDISVALNTGSGFNDFVQWGVSTDYRSLTPDYSAYGVTFNDVNGDGLPDIVGLAKEVGINTGDTFVFDAAWSANMGIPGIPAFEALVSTDSMPFSLGSPYQGGIPGAGPVEGYDSYAYKIDTSKFDPQLKVNKIADVNGDGLSDFVALRLDGIFVSLSNGKTFLPAQLWTTEIDLSYIVPFCNMMECNTSRRGWDLNDVNKDGFTDIVYTEAWYMEEKSHASNIKVLFSKGSFREGSGFYSSHLVASVGLDGSPTQGLDACSSSLSRLGKPRMSELGDFVVHCQPHFESAEAPTNIGLPFNRSYDEAMDIGIRNHKILRVLESDSRTIDIAYDKLVNSSVYTHQAIVGSASEYASTQVTGDYPVHAASGESGSKATNSKYPAIFRGREVVSSLEIYSQGALSKTTDFKYFTQKFGRDGWGSLGFEKVQRTTTFAGHSEKHRNVTEYLQEVASDNSYRLVKPYKIETCVVSSDAVDGCDINDGAQRINDVIKNWKVRVYDGDSPRFYPYAVEEQTRNYDVASGTLLSTVVKRMYDDGITESCPALSTITGANRTATIDEHFDAYGTPLNVMENRCDTFGVTGVHTDNDNVLNDTVNWCLNLTQDPRVHKWVYDGSSSATNSITRHTNFSYNSSGNGRCQVATETREPDAGNAIWLQKSYSYNAYGSRHSLTETVRDFTGDGIGFTSRTNAFTESYDSAGERTVVTTNALGHQTTQVFNTDFGLVKRAEGPNGLVSTLSYDVMGRPVTSVARGVSTHYAYRRCNNCFAYNDTATWYAQQKTEGQSAQRSYFDSVGREVGKRWRGLLGTHYYAGQRYNALGQIAATTQPFSNAATASSLETVNEYDVLGRLVRSDFPSGAYQTLEYTVVEDAAARISTDSLSHSKTQRFDALGREKEVTDALGTSVHYWHDALGNVTDIRVVDALQSDPIDHEIVFDKLGRKTQLNDPDVGVIDYTYNALGKLTRQVNGEGQRLCYFYDTLDRQIQRRDNANSDCSGGTLQSWTYDRPGELGLLAEVSGRDTNNRVHSETYTYTLEHFLPESVTQVIDGESFTLTHYYDMYNRPVGKSYPTGFTVEQRYTTYGAAYQAVNVQNGEVLWQANDDDARGNITHATFGNGATVTSAFSAATGLLNTRSALLGTHTLQDHTYTFDAEGNLRSRRDDRPGVGITQHFCYDPLYRLTDQVINSTCNDDTNGSYSGTAYAYDIHGNITRKDGITDYQYGQSAQNAGPHAVSFASGGDYIYDDAGRMVGSPLNRTITYSAFGKPTYMGIANVYETRIIYGALQKRVQREDNDNGAFTLTTYVNKDYERIEKPDGSTEHRHYLNDWGVHIYTENNTATEQYTVYLTRDHIGSIASKSDDRTGSEQTIKHHANEPWGRRQDESWSGSVYDTLRGSELEDMTFGTNRGFTDHEHLDGIGLIHMNGRVYDPVIGRFLSPDPWIQDPNNSQSFNRYSYVWNNPLRYTDPTGEVSMDQAAEMGLIDTGSGCESDPSCKDVGNIGDDGASGSGKAGDTSTPEMGQQGGNENRDLQASGAETSGGAAENAQGNTTADSTNGSAVRQTQSAGAEGEAAQNLGAGAAPVSTENAGDAGRVDEEMVVYGRAQESSSSGSQEAHSSFIRGLIGKHLQGTLSVKAGFILAVTFKINVAPDGKVSVYTGGGLGAGLDVGAEAGMAANLIENDSADQDYQEGFTTDLSVSGGFGGHGSASFQAGEGGVTGGAGIGLGAGASMSVTIGYTWNF